jgi:hypothetical protein
VNQSELVNIYFTHGSVMSLDTGSNAQDLLPDRNAEPLGVNFRVHWVPPKK